MKIIAICTNTFREAVRDKILYSLVFFALLMICVGSFMDRVTIGQTDKIILDFGLASISIFGVLISIFVGVGLVFKEIDKRTIYSIVSKPIERWEFLLGKYLGLILTLFVEVALMTFGLAVAMALFSTHGLQTSFLFAILLTFLELCLMTAVAVFFSSFSTPFMSGFFTLAIFVIGHLTQDLKAFSTRLDEMGQMIIQVLFYLLPNLEIFNLRGWAVHGKEIPYDQIFLATSYGIFYIATVFVLSVIIFQRREFK